MTGELMVGRYMGRDTPPGGAESVMVTVLENTLTGDIGLLFSALIAAEEAEPDDIRAAVVLSRKDAVKLAQWIWQTAGSTGPGSSN